MKSLTKLNRTHALSRTIFWGGLGASAALAVLLGVSQVPDTLTDLDQEGFAQTLRQTAWDRALTGQPVAGTWPWDTVSSNLSLTISEKGNTVRRLGLSASLHNPSDHSTSAIKATTMPSLASERSGAGARVSIEGDIALGDVGPQTVAIGDRITFTANDGATCIYQVSGQPVVDPHLASDEAGRAAGQSGLFQCGPLESLIMQATRLHDDQGAKAKVHPIKQRNL